jgi:hypothetical protein
MHGGIQGLLGDDEEKEGLDDEEQKMVEDEFNHIYMADAKLREIL